MTSMPNVPKPSPVFRERLRAAAAHGHGAARRSEAPGQLSPDTRGPADDQNGAVGEIHEIFAQHAAQPTPDRPDGAIIATTASERWHGQPVRVLDLTPLTISPAAHGRQNGG